jgi:hypothetical protein
MKYIKISGTNTAAIRKLNKFRFEAPSGRDTLSGIPSSNAGRHLKKFLAR